MECPGGCGYPMCSASCGDVREHREFECAAFREKGYKVPDTHPLYPGNLKGANAKYNTNHN